MRVLDPFNQAGRCRAESLEGVSGKIVIFNHFLYVVRVHQGHRNWNKQPTKMLKKNFSVETVSFNSGSETWANTCCFN